MISDDFQRLQITDRRQLRKWLAANHGQADGIWLVTFKKHGGARHVPYDAIVEEVLCFGWIDSLPRRLDDDRTMLFLSPRRPGSPWSRLNKNRVAKLDKAGQLEPPGQAKIDEAKADGSWVLLDDVEDLVIPNDLAGALESVPDARRHFDAFSDSSKKAILWWIKSAKRAPTREKRIHETAELAGQNIRANHPRDRG